MVAPPLGSHGGGGGGRGGGGGGGYLRQSMRDRLMQSHQSKSAKTLSFLPPSLSLPLLAAQSFAVFVSSGASHTPRNMKLAAVVYSTNGRSDIATAIKTFIWHRCFSSIMAARRPYRSLSINYFSLTQLLSVDSVQFTTTVMNGNERWEEELQVLACQQDGECSQHNLAFQTKHLPAFIYIYTTL